MERVQQSPRPDWQKKAEEIGFSYHSCGETPEDLDGVYWDETVSYKFSASEIDLLEIATKNLHDMCLEAVEYLTTHQDELEYFDIPNIWQEYAIKSWRRRDPHLMGRFDLAFSPMSGNISMLEYNADTPTLAIETSLMQWFWKQEVHPDADQFNSFHEKLLATFIDLKMPENVLYFASLEDYWEEKQHSLYFRDLADQAGIITKSISMADIGYFRPDDGSKGWFVDKENNRIHHLHKLYPWEWMREDRFGSHILEDTMSVIEPAWKMFLSNKAILPLLWKLFPNHTNLLPAFHHEDSSLGGNYVRKPILGREGANMVIKENGNEVCKTPGSYATNRMIFQARAEMPRFDNMNVVLGSWVVGNEAAGIIVREDTSPIVVNTSRVVPHFLIDLQKNIFMA